MAMQVTAKRMLSAVVCTLLMAAVFLFLPTLQAFADEVEYLDPASGLTFNLDDDDYTAEVTEAVTNDDIVNLVIPSSVTKDGDTYTVRAVDTNAFWGAANLESIAFPETLEIIYDAAFASSSKLASVKIPAGVTYIGSSAFENCTALETITFEGVFPQNVKGDRDAWYGVASSGELTIYMPAGAKEEYKEVFGRRVFRASSASGDDSGDPLEITYTEYDSPSIIAADGMFFQVTSSIPPTAKLAKLISTSPSVLTIPSSVQKNGTTYIVTEIEEVFSGYSSSITSVTIPESITKVGTLAFSCPNLTTITFQGQTPPELENGSFYEAALHSPYTLNVFVPAGTARAYEVAMAYGNFRKPMGSLEPGQQPIPLTLNVLEHGSTPPNPEPTATSPSAPSPSTLSVPPVVVKPEPSSGSASGTAMEMIASQLPSGVKPADVAFSAKPQAPEAASMQAVQAALAAHPSLPKALSITAYDLDLLLKASGEKVNFTGKVTVTLPVPAGYGRFLRVFYVADDGTMAEVPAVINGGNILLTLEHFSTYAIVDFASSAGKLPATLKASGATATATAASEAVKPSGEGNATANPKTGAAPFAIPSLLALGGAALIAYRLIRRKADQPLG